MRDDAAFMRRALMLARHGWGRVHPNPLVGAVIVRDDTIVGEGFHEEYGAAHAEVNALRNAGDAARGATLYVTLEPCAHHGKTPPCTDAILAAGIARVVYAAADPSTTARGGAQRLRDAGVDVIGGVERDAARRDNAAFFTWHEHARPFVALKLATSLDGRIAAAPGARTQLTGRDAMCETHRLRAGFDAILVGRTTATIDDPLLTVRHHAVRTPPLRIVADTDAQLALTSRLVQTVEDAPVVVLCATDAPADRVAALEDAGVRIVRVPRSASGVDVAAALDRLARKDVRSVFVEGGAKLASSLIVNDRVDRLLLFVAPTFLGAGGVPAFALDESDARARFSLAGHHSFGDDVLLTYDRREHAMPDAADVAHDRTYTEPA